jgi:hypothetical protein
MSPHSVDEDSFPPHPDAARVRFLIKKFLFIRAEDEDAAIWERMCLQLLVWPSRASKEQKTLSHREQLKRVRQVVGHLLKVEKLYPTVAPFVDLCCFDIEDPEKPVFADYIRQLLNGARAAKSSLEQTVPGQHMSAKVTAKVQFLLGVRTLLEKRQFELRDTVPVRKIDTGFTRRGYLAKFAAALWNCANEKHVRASDFDYEIDVARQEHHRWQTPPPKRH